jgi:menaquinol-cytochrome c reductase iron-sulfur subunit
MNTDSSDNEARTGRTGDVDASAAEATTGSGAKIESPWLPGYSPPAGESHTGMTATRRQFLTKVGVALSGLSGVLLVGPVVGFLLAPLFRKPPEIWRSVGPVSNFKVGETVEVTFEEASPLPWSGTTARAAAWLRRNGEQDFTVFTVQCTHLGCPVSWLPGAKLFMCPCHGGVYYLDGRVAAGPPPAALPRYPVRVRAGQVELMVSATPQSPDLNAPNGHPVVSGQ